MLSAATVLFYFRCYLVEVIFFLYKTAYSVLEPTVKLYLVESVCAERFPNESVQCANSATPPNLTADPGHAYREHYTQETAAHYLFWYKLFLNVPTLFLMLWIGTWSDKIGRKKPICLSIIAMIITASIYLVSRSSKVSNVTFILVGAFINGCFGKSAVITMAVYSFASDYTEKSERTKRIARLTAMNFVGQFTGTLFIGMTLDQVTFRTVFIGIIFLNTVTLMLALFGLEDVKQEFIEESYFATLEANEEKAREQREAGRTSTCGWFLGYFRESIQVLTRVRDNNGRYYINATMFIIMVHQMCKQGEVDIKLLFVERAPFHWSKSMYGFLLAATNAAIGLGSFFLLPYLSKQRKLTDVTINKVGVVSKVLRVIWLAASRWSWMIYCGAAFEIGGGMLNGGLKAMASKLVDEQEFGRCFSLISSMESIANLLGPLIFTNFYAFTQRWMAPATFLLEATIYGTLFIVLVLLGSGIQTAASANFLHGEVNNASESGNGEGSEKMKQDASDTSEGNPINYNYNETGNYENPGAPQTDPNRTASYGYDPADPTYGQANYTYQTAAHDSTEERHSEPNHPYNAADNAVYHQHYGYDHRGGGQNQAR